MHVSLLIIVTRITSQRFCAASLRHTHTLQTRPVCITAIPLLRCATLRRKSATLCALNCSNIASNGMPANAMYTSLPRRSAQRRDATRRDAERASQCAAVFFFVSRLSLHTSNHYVYQSTYEYDMKKKRQRRLLRSTLWHGKLSTEFSKRRTNAVAPPTFMLLAQLLF